MLLVVAAAPLFGIVKREFLFELLLGFALQAQVFGFHDFIRAGDPYV